MLGFFDEDQKFIPDKSRSGDLLAEGLINIDSPVDTSNPGTGIGQLMNDRDNADFGEMDQINDVSIDMVTAGVFSPETPTHALPTQPKQTEVIPPNDPQLQNTSTFGDTGRRMMMYYYLKNFNQHVVLPRRRPNIDSNATITNPQSTSNSGTMQASIRVVSQGN
jgi:hypothetical protein